MPLERNANASLTQFSLSSVSFAQTVNLLEPSRGDGIRRYASFLMSFDIVIGSIDSNTMLTSEVSSRFGEINPFTVNVFSSLYFV